MADLYEKLKELVGSDDLAKQVQSALGEYMIPKTEYAKQRDKAKELEAQLEQTKLSSMNETEKLQHEIAKSQALQTEYAKRLNRVKAESTFVKAGLSEDDYGLLLDQSVSESEEETLSRVNTFVNILNKTKETVSNKVKEDLMNKVVTPPNPEPTPTKPLPPKKNVI